MWWQWRIVLLYVVSYVKYLELIWKTLNLRQTTLQGWISLSQPKTVDRFKTCQHFRNGYQLVDLGKSFPSSLLWSWWNYFAGVPINIQLLNHKFISFFSGDKKAWTLNVQEWLQDWYINEERIPHLELYGGRPLGSSGQSFRWLS